jgi:hypothetical protein
LGAGAGFEPASAEAQSADDQRGCAVELCGRAQGGAQKVDPIRHELNFVAAAWSALPPELRQAIIMIIRVHHSRH